LRPRDASRIADGVGSRGAMEDVLESPAAAVKPRLRGVIHQWSFFVAVVGVAVLLVMAHGAREHIAVAIYGATLCGLLGASALYHRVTWSPRRRRVMRQL